MSHQHISAFVGVLLAIIGVAALAVIVSNKSQSGSVLTQGGSTFGQMIDCALSPITGNNCRTSVNSILHF